MNANQPEWKFIVEKWKLFLEAEIYRKNLRFSGE
jgi:hypothetical protein